ncbi:hypothetical protein QBC46DRAFT_395604 [Diplogelasinospora grovesii]|uniref:Stc1 domain-containing protein n=1 Tax=Diplogelasinospora grovesii TaxID=303347 RepID=A0AAN6N0Q1_9PEZI|nr:hypothetical protein QBC46DRAFT_395604 [Diplogelasinospora grovesii]
MSTNSGRTGFCKVCKHANNEHSYEECSWKKCKEQIKICKCGSHQEWGVDADQRVICKECSKHGRSTTKEAYNRYAVIGTKKRVLKPRDSTPPMDESTYVEGDTSYGGESSYTANQSYGQAYSTHAYGETVGGYFNDRGFFKSSTALTHGYGDDHRSSKWGGCVRRFRRRH